jgi:PAS domain S-box-containing protein
MGPKSFVPPSPATPPAAPARRSPDALLGDALRAIVQATSAATGPDFFRSLVKHLAAALNCRYAVLGEAVGDPANRVRTLACWTGQECAENFEYDLAGTPCENVIGRETCRITRDARRRFPHDRILTDLKVEAYLGVPLFDSGGNSIGILLVMHDQPHDFPHGDAILRIFGTRAAAEMERLWREQALRTAYETMETRVRERTADLQRANEVLKREVARREQAEKEARQNATELRMMLQAFPDLHFRLAADGRILGYSAAPQTKLYLPPDQFLGRRMRDFLPPDVGRSIHDAIDEVVRTKSHTRVEYPLTIAGENRWWEARFAPFLGDEVLMIVRDMTERKKADEALRFQKSLLEAQGEASIEGILVVSDAGRILSHNKRFLEMWRVPPDVIASRSDEPLLAYATRQTADPDGFLHRVRELYAHPALTSHDEVRLKDGRTLDRYSAPIVGEGNRHYGRVWFFRDVTEQKRAEEAIRVSESRFRTMIEQSPISVQIITADGRTREVNRAWEQLWGLTLENIADHNVFTDPQLTENGLDEYVRRAFAGETVTIPPCRYVPHQGRFANDPRWVRAVVYPVQAHAGAAPEVVIKQEDITDLITTEEALRASEREARQSAESNRRLLMEVDHRVKNNLAGLLALVQVTRSRAASVQSFADAIESRLLAMSHVHLLLAEGGWRAMRFRPFVQSLLTAIEGLARHRIDVTLDGPDVMIEPHHALPLTMILVEWFTNSAKYGAHSTESGHLTVRWNVTTADDASGARTVHLHWTESGGPPITHPLTGSLGTQLIQSFASRELQGRVHLTYPPSGADHLLEFPL